VATNLNLLAVYARGDAVSTAEMARIAARAGFAVRFLSFGIFAHAGEVCGNVKPCETCLLCGWQEPGTVTTREFDAACRMRDREKLTKLMKSEDVSWVELYTNHFDYEGLIRKKPRDQSKIDGSVPPELLLALKAATTRYIFHNKSRRKTGATFMSAILSALAESIDGIVTNYLRPSR
jgi:hypothetical protein